MSDATRLNVDVGRSMSEAEKESVARVIAAEVFRLDRIAEAQPHAVHLDPNTEDGWPLQCPDCGRSLVAGNDPTVEFNFLTCGFLPSGQLPEKPCHAGCLVACGMAA